MTLILSCLKRSTGLAEAGGEASCNRFHGIHEIQGGGEVHRLGVRPTPSQVGADDLCLLDSLSDGWSGSVVVSAEDLLGEESEAGLIFGLEALVGDEATAEEGEDLYYSGLRRRHDDRLHTLGVYDGAC